MSTHREELKDAIDVLRDKLNKRSECLSMLTAGEMLELSQNLDELIVSYYYKTSKLKYRFG